MAAHSAVRCFPVDDPSSVGHFPGNPIIPGAAILQEVVRVVTADGHTMCGGVRAAKFLHPIRPGDCLTIAWDETPTGDFAFVCSTGTPERRVATGTLHSRAHR
jgi:3-hydroxyacyl-[acyl-carrier-protein] dehydratase